MRDTSINTGADGQMVFKMKLVEIFSEAQNKNSSYSLRAFARRLAVSPSALSEILNGKRRVSRKFVQKTLVRLALPPNESFNILEHFPSVVCSNSNSKNGHSSSKGKNKRDSTNSNSNSDSDSETRSSIPSLELAMDQYHLISEWYHFAILSLAEIENFRSDVKWIASRLGIKIPEAKAAINRLLKLGLIKEDEKGNLISTGIQYKTTDEVANLAIRRAHVRNLELAQNSLEKYGVSERDFTSRTFAIDVSKLPEAKKLIRKFREDMSNLLEVGNKTEVYTVCINLFPLSDLHFKEEKEQEEEEKESSILS
ncbi:MAG: TIGR02147 family protein [Oligoflexia bacterium]|nr:TIGR02147 family protein [Oligoflexia bacterium]